MRIVKLAALVASLGLMAGTAQAAVVTLVFSGTVKSGTDGAGLFGTSGADLAGLAFTSTYLIDDSNATVGLHDVVFVYGGPYLGTPSPLVSAELMINGISYAAGPGGYGAGFTAQYAQNANYPYNYYQQLQAYSTDPGLADSLVNTCIDKPKLSLAAMTCDSRGDGLFGFANDATFGELITTSASMSPPLGLGVSYAPEPTTWVMMIAGFGLVGGALRRRRELAA